MAGNVIEFQLDEATMKAVQIKLKNMKAKAPNAMRNAINQTATAANRKIKKGRSQGYTIKAGEFNKQITIQRANRSHMDATIKAKGRTRTIKEFKTKMSAHGAKTDIVKSGLKSLVNEAGATAFIGTGGKVKGLYVQRETKNRYPLRILHANSVPIMAQKIYEGERGNQGNLSPYIQNLLYKNLSKQIDKILGGR